MLMAREAARRRPQGDVSCAKISSRPVPRRIEQNDRVLFPVVRDHRWSSTRLFPCGIGTILNDPSLVYDLLLRWHIQGNCLCSQTVQKSALRNGARRTCRNSGTNGGKGTASCGCNIGALIPTLLPSFSSTFGVNSLTSASSSKLPVHHSPGGNRLIVRAFTTPHGVPTSTVFDPSVGPKYVPCSNRQSKGPKRRLDGCRDMHHTHSPNTAPLPTFLSYAVLPSDQPQTDGVCWLHTAQATSTDHGMLAAPHKKLTPLPV